MAIRFFWRGESDTLDATHDYSAGDTTGSSNSGCVCDSTISVVPGNTNSVYVAAASDHFRFDNTGISSDLASVGSAAFAIKITGNPGGAPECGLKLRGSSTTAANVTTTLLNTGFASNIGQIRFRHAGTTLIPSSGGSALSLNTLYGVVYRWDQPNSLRRLEIYNSSGSLIEAVENTDAFTAPTWGVQADGGIRVGEDSGINVTCGIANAMISDTYAEPLEDYLYYNSYTEIGGSSTPKGRMLTLGVG